MVYRQTLNLTQFFVTNREMSTSKVYEPISRVTSKNVEPDVRVSQRQIVVREAVDRSRHSEDSSHRKTPASQDGSMTTWFSRPRVHAFGSFESWSDRHAGFTSHRPESMHASARPTGAHMRKPPTSQTTPTTDDKL